MTQSLSEIYTLVENNNTMSYTNYCMVIDALELKHKDNNLNESLDKELDLVYYVEAILNNNNMLLEWSMDDMKNSIDKARLKAVELGDAALKKAADMIESFKVAYRVTYDAFLQLGINLKLGMNEVFNTLREKGIWEAVKALKGVAGSAIGDLYVGYTTAYKETSALIFGSINQTEIGEKLKQGSGWIKEFAEKNPKFKYVLGPIIAYTLYYIWTKMVFKGDFIYDFNWKTNFDALMGDFDIVQIFSGEEGVELISWFTLGLTGMFPSAAWLDGELLSLFGGWGNHALAILATIMIYLNDKYPAILDRPIIHEIKNKLCKRDQKLALGGKGVEALKGMAIDKGIYVACNGPKCS